MIATGFFANHTDDDGNYCDDDDCTGCTDDDDNGDDITLDL